MDNERMILITTLYICSVRCLKVWKGGHWACRSDWRSDGGTRWYGHWACRSDRTRRRESGISVKCNWLLMNMFVNAVLWNWQAALRNSNWINWWYFTLAYSTSSFGYEGTCAFLCHFKWRFKIEGISQDTEAVLYLPFGVMVWFDV